MQKNKMDLKITKGEWISSGYRVDVDVADGLSGICEMSDWMEECEMKANAKLIAAAPDLLKSLQESVKAMKIVTSSAIKPFIERAEQAIKKATE